MFIQFGMMTFFNLILFFFGITLILYSILLTIKCFNKWLFKEYMYFLTDEIIKYHNYCIKVLLYKVKWPTSLKPTIHLYSTYENIDYIQRSDTFRERDADSLHNEIYTNFQKSSTLFKIMTHISFFKRRMWGQNSVISINFNNSTCILSTFEQAFKYDSPSFREVYSKIPITYLNKNKWLRPFKDLVVFAHKNNIQYYSGYLNMRPYLFSLQKKKCTILEIKLIFNIFLNFIFWSIENFSVILQNKYKQIFNKNGEQKYRCTKISALH